MKSVFLSLIVGLVALANTQTPPLTNRAKIEPIRIQLTSLEVIKYQKLASGFIEQIYGVRPPNHTAFQWKSGLGHPSIKLSSPDFYVSVDYPTGLLRSAIDTTLTRYKSRNFEGTVPLKLSDDAWYKKGQQLAAKLWPGFAITRKEIKRDNERGQGSIAGSNYSNTVTPVFWTKPFEGRRRLMSLTFDDATGKVVDVFLGPANLIKR
jgi:hypothetical protein